jgi:hypothetical protein
LGAVLIGSCIGRWISVKLQTTTLQVYQLFTGRNDSEPNQVYFRARVCACVRKNSPTDSHTVAPNGRGWSSSSGHLRYQQRTENLPPLLSPLATPSVSPGAGAKFPLPQASHPVTPVPDPYLGVRVDGSGIGDEWRAGRCYGGQDGRPICALKPEQAEASRAGSE